MYMDTENPLGSSSFCGRVVAVMVARFFFSFSSLLFIFCCFFSLLSHACIRVSFFRKFYWTANSNEMKRNQDMNQEVKKKCWIAISKTLLIIDIIFTWNFFDCFCDEFSCPVVHMGRAIDNRHTLSLGAAAAAAAQQLLILNGNGARPYFHSLPFRVYICTLWCNAKSNMYIIPWGSFSHWNCSNGHKISQRTFNKRWLRQWNFFGEFVERNNVDICCFDVYV